MRYQHTANIQALNAVQAACDPVSAADIGSAVGDTISDSVTNVVTPALQRLTFTTRSTRVVPTTINPMPPDIDAIAETTADFIEELSGPKTGKVQRLGATWNLQHLPTSVRTRYDMVLTRKPIPVALL